MVRILVVVITLVALAACSGDDPARPERQVVEYQIDVDSIEVPDAIAADEPLVVKVYGVIGPSNCFLFDRAEVEESASLFDLVFVGVRDISPDALCIGTQSIWAGREFLKQPPHGASVRVVVHRPDGATIEETVVVE